MHMKIYKLIILLIFFSNLAFAETHNFNCSGNRTTKGGIYSSEFDMTVTTAPLEINGPVGPMGLCHLTANEETRKNIKFSCEMSESELKCSCSGGDFIFNSIHQLSRLTGKLTAISTIKGDVWVGEYNCRKVKSKLF